MVKGESADRSETQPPVQAPPTQNQLPQKQTDATPAPVATPAKPHAGYILIWHVLISFQDSMHDSYSRELQKYWHPSWKRYLELIKN